MKIPLRILPRQPPWSSRRLLHHSSHRMLPSTQPSPLVPAPSSPIDLQAFRDEALNPQKPYLISRDAAASTSELPAASKWFQQVGVNNASWSLAPYMNQFQEWPFPYEVVTPTAPDQQALVAFRDWLLSSKEPADQLLTSILKPPLTDLGAHSFFQLFAPLRLLMKALEFNRSRPPGGPGLVSLYIAQSSLPDLPPALLEDLPTPDLVRHAGKGDVYNSSVWLGTEPTYTPLHRDPNPNLFCQLCNTKLVRLMPPAQGDRLFFDVQKLIRQQANSRIRTVDMMEGKERKALHEAVWLSDALPEGLYEAELEPGDSLFIPNGWWHSVKSKASHGHLNGSVNWWFR